MPHTERQKEYDSNYRTNNKEKIAKANKKWGSNNKDKKNETQKRYYAKQIKSNPHFKWKVFVDVNKKRKNKREITITEEQHNEIILQKCWYCNKPATPFHGLDRQDNNKGYTQDNVVSCCPRCNYAKGEMTVQEFVQMCSEVYCNKVFL